ncbi:MAG: hypothetical protein WAM09_14050, partial [Anaerolineales bacterium]
QMALGTATMLRDGLLEPGHMLGLPCLHSNILYSSLNILDTAGSEIMKTLQVKTLSVKTLQAKTLQAVKTRRHCRQ